MLKRIIFTIIVIMCGVLPALAQTDTLTKGTTKLQLMPDGSIQIRTFGVLRWVIQSDGTIRPVTTNLNSFGTTAIRLQHIFTNKINGYTLPADGTPGQVLTTNGAGVWSFQTPESAGGSGTVTSVGAAFSVPLQSIFSVTGSPVTASGDLTFDFLTQPANMGLFGPASGAAAKPAFRLLVPADVPALDAAKITTGIFAPARLGSGTPGVSNFLRGDSAWSGVNTTDISGLGTAAVLNVAASGNAGASEVVKGSDTRLTDARTPTGGAGGVLSGTFPSPGFAVDMAEQSEVDTALATNSSGDRARANHTGTQAISTVSGLQSALDAKANLISPVFSTFVELAEQGSAPSTPTNAARFFVDSSNRFSWKGENGFVRTFDGTSNTADRVYTLPNANSSLPIASQFLTFTGPTVARTITLPDANFTAARTDDAQTFTGNQRFDGLIQFGGTTSSFPAWKRSGAALHARLADDSGYAAVNLKTWSAAVPSGNLDNVMTGSSGQAWSLGVPSAGTVYFYNVTNNRTPFQISAAAPSDAFVLTSTMDFGVTVRANNVTPVTSAGGDLGSTSLRWKQVWIDSTITGAGTTGDRTINKALFSVNFAASAGSLTVTNSLVGANSLVLCTVQANDATLKSVAAVPSAGSVVLHPNAAATAETKVACQVFNQ